MLPMTEIAPRIVADERIRFGKAVREREPLGVLREQATGRGQRLLLAAAGESIHQSAALGARMAHAVRCDRQ